MSVETFTRFSHSNSVHILRNYSNLSRKAVTINKGPYLLFGACCRLNVIHDINVNVAENHTCFCCSWFPDDVAKDHTGFRGRYLLHISTHPQTNENMWQTLIEVFILWKLCGPRVWVLGFSTSFRSPKVANSRQRFCIVTDVWLTIRTSVVTLAPSSTHFSDAETNLVKYQSREPWRMLQRKQDQKTLQLVVRLNNRYYRKTYHRPVSCTTLFKLEAKSSATSPEPVALETSISY